MRCQRRGSDLSIYANMDATALDIPKDKWLSSKASIADKEAYTRVSGKAVRLQKELTQVRGEADMYKDMLVKLAKRIDEASGSPVFTEEEHHAIAMLCGLVDADGYPV